MVRKIIVAICIAMLLCGSTCMAAEPYEQSISSTYLQYARDIIPNLDVEDDYVFYRSGQYEHILVAGEIEYNGSTFSSTDVLDSYVFTSGSGYNSDYTYSTGEVKNFNLSTSNKMVYSNLGQFPRLVERGSDYEVYQTIFMFIVALCVVIRSIFTANRRG